jgi:hypothetical protein
MSGYINIYLDVDLKWRSGGFLGWCRKHRFKRLSAV